jgi:hypothetical protein
MNTYQNESKSGISYASVCLNMSGIKGLLSCSFSHGRKKDATSKPRKDDIMRNNQKDKKQ